jgi:hypothetical protein
VCALPSRQRRGPSGASRREGRVSNWGSPGIASLLEAVHGRIRRGYFSSSTIAAAQMICPSKPSDSAISR